MRLLDQGLKREELIASNSMILHELFFASLGEESEPWGALRDALTRDFGSVDHWRAEFSAMGKAQAGGSGWVLLIWSPRDRKLINQWAMDHTTTFAGGQPILALGSDELGLSLRTTRCWSLSPSAQRRKCATGSAVSSTRV